MYIIMDLDATLLNNEGKVSRFTLDVLKLCRKKGHKIVFNTARNFVSTKDLIFQVKPDFAITNAGALITCGTDKIFDEFVSTDMTNKIVKDFKKLGITEFSIESPEGLFTNSEEYPNKNPNATYFDFFNNKFMYGAYKIMFSTEKKELAAKIRKSYNLQLANYMGSTWHRLSVTNKHMGNLNLYKVLNDLNPVSICFGDDHGDKEMILGATIGVALKNSVEDVLTSAPNVTQFVANEDGVARHLLELLNNKTI